MTNKITILFGMLLLWSLNVDAQRQQTITGTVSSTELVEFEATSLSGARDVLQLTVPAGSIGANGDFLECNNGISRVAAIDADGDVVFRDGVFRDIVMTGSENTGTNAALEINNGASTMYLDGNEIDCVGGMFLNTNNLSEDKAIYLRSRTRRTDVNVMHTSGGGNGGNDGFSIENAAANNNYWTMYTANGTGNFELYFNGTIRGRFDDATGAYTTASDARLKEDIKQMDDVLSKVMKMQAKKYHFKNDETKSEALGFLAQDVENYFPQIIDKNVVGDTEEVVYTMDYSSLGVIALKAIQEQQVIIEELKTEIALLKNQ